ncbi:MAG: hypothetical protein HQ591_10985 [candidate division Zixibacteria bacterium]|nr:hypothetical protein [Candidatus Tariuqbacter arcticus]
MYSTSLFKSIAIVVTISVAVLSSALAGQGAGELVRVGHIFKAEVVNEFDVKIGGKLELTRISGDVTVNSWNEEKVKIVERIRIDVYTKEEAERVYENTVLQYDRKGKIIIAQRNGGRRGNVQVTYEVTLPTKFSADIETSGGDFDIRDLTGDFRFETSGGDVKISSCEGNIDCSTSGGELELYDIKGILSAATSGGDIICVRCGDELDLRTSGGEIELKELSGTVHAKTSGGDIEVSRVEGDCIVKTSGGEITLEHIKSIKLIEAITSGGDIEVSDIEGDIKVKTSGGEILADNINGDFEGKTSGGDIEVCKVSGNLEINTSGGDVEVDGAEGYVEAGTSGGNIEVSVTKYYPKKDQHIELKSSGGGLELTLPADFKGSVEAVIHIYGASLDDYDIYSDFPLNIVRAGDEEAAKGHRKLFRKVNGIITANGDINGGGNSIILETTNGDIHIKKR